MATAGLAAKFLCVHRRESPVGQVLGHMTRFQNFSLCLKDITQMPDIVVQPVCKAVYTLHIIFQVLQLLFSRCQKVLNHLLQVVHIPNVLGHTITVPLHKLALQCNFE